MQLEIPWSKEMDLLAGGSIRRGYSTGRQSSRKYKDRHTEGRTRVGGHIINNPWAKEEIKMKIRK